MFLVNWGNNAGRFNVTRIRLYDSLDKVIEYAEEIRKANWNRYKNEPYGRWFKDTKIFLNGYQMHVWDIEVNSPHQIVRIARPALMDEAKKMGLI